jgi:DNA-binding transcriptional ArsR family regulator
MLGTTMEALAEPNRRRIVALLAAGERPVTDIVDALPLSQPTVSKHLRVLRDAGLVVARPDAQRRMYRLVAEPWRELDEWLRPFRQLWAERLDALERHLDDVSQAAASTERDQPQPRRSTSSRRRR